MNSDADIILLDEPLAAMGAKEGSQILDLVARLKEEGKVSIIMIPTTTSTCYRRATG